MLCCFFSSHFEGFLSDTGLRRQWEVAIRKEGFVATESSKLCSEHFKPDDFDRTGQIVRLRDGATPSVFNFPSHLQRVCVFSLYMLTEMSMIRKTKVKITLC